MGMGRHGEVQPEMWVAASELPRSPGHTFYDKLNLVREALACQPLSTDIRTERAPDNRRDADGIDLVCT